MPKILKFELASKNIKNDENISSRPQKCLSLYYSCCTLDSRRSRQDVGESKLNYKRIWERLVLRD